MEESIIENIIKNMITAGFILLFLCIVCGISCLCLVGQVVYGDWTCAFKQCVIVQEVKKWN